MNSIDIFFKTTLMFFFLLSCIMLLTGGVKTVSTFKEAKKEKQEMDFNGRGFFFTVIIPAIYMISFGLSYYGVVG